MAISAWWPIPRRRQFFFRHVASLVALVGLLVWPRLQAAPSAASIRPGDSLSITVFEHGNLSSTVRVQEDGRIRLPLCGWVDAGGKTPGELAEALSKAYQAVDIERAFVMVTITDYGPRTVYVIGEILQGGTSLEIVPPASLTVTQAVSAAGGFKDTADLRNIVVRRAAPGGGVVELNVDVLALIGGKKNISDLDLEVGDTVIIPRAKPVYLTGEVASPGVYYIGTHSALRCSEIIGLAGGLTETANRSRVLVFRREDDSQETRLYEADMQAVFGGDFTADLTLFPGDMVVVSRQLKIYVFGEVNQPGALDLAPGTSLTAFQAITLSGGFSDYASTRNVTLFREGQSESLDLRRPYRRDGEINDPPLRPGDILVIDSSIW